MLLNLAAVANTDNPSVLWGFLRRYAPSASPETHPPNSIASSTMRSPISAILSRPKSVIANPTKSSAAFCALISAKLAELPESATSDEIQHALYDVARPIQRYQDHSAKGATAARPGVSNDFFNMVYSILLGEERGPRSVAFIALYGTRETRELIEEALAGNLVL